MEGQPYRAKGGRKSGSSSVPYSCSVISPQRPGTQLHVEASRAQGCVEATGWGNGSTNSFPGASAATSRLAALGQVAGVQGELTRVIVGVAERQPLPVMEVAVSLGPGVGSGTRCSGP